MRRWTLLVVLVGIGFVVYGATLVNRGLDGREEVVVERMGSPDAMERSALYGPNIQNEVLVSLVVLGGAYIVFGIVLDAGAAIAPRRNRRPRPAHAL